MKFQNPLIITDNPFLTHRIKEAIAAIYFLDNFACTDKNVINELKEKVSENPKLINLKNEADVNHIINSYDLIFSIHCRQLFPKELLQKRRCINLHPGYNPINRGWYPQVFAIINSRIVGATIHEIDPMLDHGPIIDRIEVPQNSWDTSKSLYDRIIEAEISLFRRNIVSILNNDYQTFLPEHEGFLYHINDFKQLCEIDLNEPATFLSVINRLRALTHGSYQNAWYKDEQTGKKVFISIVLTPENG